MSVIDSKITLLVIRETLEIILWLTVLFQISITKNKTVDVTSKRGKDFPKGTYYVNIFDKDQLVSKTSFTLK
jgi:hypothetical protein